MSQWRNMFGAGQVHLSTRIPGRQLPKRYRRNFLRFKTWCNFCEILHTAVCRPKCRRGGKCIGPGLCLCREGFGGPNCQIRLKKRVTTTTTTTTTPAPVTKRRRIVNRLKKRKKSKLVAKSPTVSQLQQANQLDNNL